MPGFRIMNNMGADGAAGPRDGESKKRSHDGKLVNGDRIAATKETASGAVSAPTNASGVNGVSVAGPSMPAPAPAPAQYAQLPPEIAQVGPENYHSLAKLLIRHSQDLYNDTYEVLTRMSEYPTSHQTNGHMTNGLGPYGMSNGQDNSEQNRAKKLLLMRYAQENRAKMIKLLVLTEWGKKSAADVATLIDLLAWAREQSDHMDRVDGHIEAIKYYSSFAREANPDIRTALEILATGKAGWIPDMGYVPPEPISSESALKLLRYMNTSLSIRLNVHENLPRHLQKWRVESGRATFIVDDEFEMDVLSFVEDASDQWHFIDLRLLFSPAPSIALQSRFLFHLKLQLDAILKDSGLSGCFDHLHNFILTHKIDILNTQAVELLRSGWAGSLKVEPVHRSLIIQYWTNKPGKKNWIEIGIASNKPKNGKISWRGPPIPSLAVRWFRQGVEVKDVDLKFDWKILSMERMLKRVIALHIGHLLSSTREGLSPAMTVKATLPATEPSDCMLEASMGTSAIKTTLSVEPVTGRYILQPATAISSEAENAINHPRTTSSTSIILTKVLARSVLSSIQKCTQQLGWHPVARQALRVDVIKAAVGLDVLEYALFWPRGWSTNWALAAIIDSSGESWWICEMNSKTDSIDYARRIHMEKHDGVSPPINRATLSSIERVAVHMLAFDVTVRMLRKENKAWNMGYEFASPRLPTGSLGIVRGWVLQLKTSDLLPSKPGEAPWLEPTMRVMCEGTRSDHRNMWHIASGTMVPDAAAHMKKLMSASPQNNFSFSKGGNFSILLSTPFGEEIVSQLQAQLRDVDRLRSFAATLEKRKMQLLTSSLGHVQFQYSNTLSATVKFEKDDEIDVDFPSTNPHCRIQKLLVELANEKSTSLVDIPLGDNTGLDRFCTTLLYTRPLLSTLSRIEDLSPGSMRSPAVHTHSIGVYRLTYDNPPCSFDVRLRSSHDHVVWHVEDNEGKPTEYRHARYQKKPDALKAALSGLFKQTGERWYGTRIGMIAEIDGIPAALKKLHETIIGLTIEGGYPQESDDGAPGPSGANPGQAPGSGPSNNQSGGGQGGAPRSGGPPNSRPGGPGSISRQGNTLGSSNNRQGSGSASNPRQQSSANKISNVGGKPTMSGIKREVITID